MCVILHMSVITQNGWSALMEAAMEGKTEVVVELVKAGANVDMKTKVCQLSMMYMYRSTHDCQVGSKAMQLMFIIMYNVCLYTSTSIRHACFWLTSGTTENVCI